MDVFLARQPIFDSEQKVSAYEILYRSGLVNNFDGIDGDEASREVIFNTFQTFGIENLTNAKPVFINFTESLINDETATLFSKDLLVVEILEDVLPSEQVIENSKSLKEMGYKIALDDFIYKPEYEELIELADIVKIDFLLSDKEEIKRLSRDLKKRNIELLAEKVETREDFEYAKKLGFSLFQGFFFSKPEIVISKKIQPIKATCLQLVSKVNEKEIDFGKIANIVSMDLSLTYNLLKLVNSAAFGFRYRIKSVKHAVVALGEREIKKWIYLVVVNTIGEDEPDELTRLSLIRARFAELIAINTRYKKQSEEMFLLGLFSLLDVILRRPISEVLDEVKASNVIKAALIDGNGEIGIIYKMIIAYEKAEWDEVLLYAESLDIDCYLIVKAYMDALLWYNKLVG
ncbi:HDOD domain-containing protein [Tissierella carlieri]|uniref:EAL and HDOD domain-containing protein n=1 Tax=Tissierella carlieri TaxID=689904 RepID=UPI001C1247C4|nr:HDOD domain-containing protein [Tissierella carlieri]MBU5314065.1 HDOD domain-containing protein [Tissierella carlieri]